ncbi:MAG: hypothetical protein ACC656_02630, partial [Candidatus Heimdallarchaeota archaeon]
YNKLLYGKSLLACHEGRSIFFIDNGGIIDKEKLVNDLQQNQDLISTYFIFNPTNLVQLFEIVDDLELLYIKNSKKPTIFISNIFQFLLRDPRNSKKLELLYIILGLLKTFSQNYNIPVFVSNETRKVKSKDSPFLSYLLPRFFDKIFIIDYLRGEQQSIEYKLQINKENNK